MTDNVHGLIDFWNDMNKVYQTGSMQHRIKETIKTLTTLNAENQQLEDYAAQCKAQHEAIEALNAEVERLKNLVNGRDENGKLIPSKPFVQKD